MAGRSGGAVEPASERPAEAKHESLSVFQRRWRKFRSLKRGWWSFCILVGLFLLSFLNPLLINDRALAVRHDGEWFFPVFGAFLEAEDFGQRKIGEPNYRILKAQYEKAGEGNIVILPPYPYHPLNGVAADRFTQRSCQEFFDASDCKTWRKDPTGAPPLFLELFRNRDPMEPPSAQHWMGLDNSGRDVLARVAYGYRISILFALGVVGGSYLIGVFVGACLGFFGGRIDIYGQRFVEVWAGIPFLYTVIIIASIVPTNMGILILILALFRWIGISFYTRGEFYREKAKDYVAAAISQGESNLSIMFRHVLPNSLTPIISFAPFAIVVAISSLVSLDYLGFGLPAPTPSWGELVGQGLAHKDKWHLVTFPIGALFATLLMVVFIGEAIREAFDPKVFSRLR